MNIFHMELYMLSTYLIQNLVTQKKALNQEIGVRGFERSLRIFGMFLLCICCPICSTIWTKLNWNKNLIAIEIIIIIKRSINAVYSISLMPYLCRRYNLWHLYARAQRDLRIVFPRSRPLSFQNYQAEIFQARAVRYSPYSKGRWREGVH